MRSIYRAGAGALAIGLATVALGQQPARTLQQDFDAATALDAGTDKLAALAAWEALEKRPHLSTRSRAVFQVRKSAVLLDLDRKDEAVAAARIGLANLPASDPSLKEDRWNAYYNLGRIALNAVDYASAGEAFAQAEALAEGPQQRLSSLLSLIKVKTYTDPEAALAVSASAEQLLTTSNITNTVRGQFATAKGLLLMNRGDFAGARTATTAAVKLMGGLDLKVNLDEVSARSNAALALLLVGNADEARHYMAMTGAGRFPEGSINPANEMTPPDCGGEAGLKPDDMAVVEFSIGEDGSVVAARPVYAAAGGKVALEFARAATDWSWTPEQVGLMPKFFRYNIRVEMRCNLGFERPSITAGLESSLARWLEEKGQPVPDKAGKDAQSLAQQRVALAAVDSRGGAASLAAMPALAELLRNPILPREERHGVAARALAIAVANDVPVDARLGLDLAVRGSANAEGSRSSAYRRTVTAMLDQQPYATSPHAKAALMMLLAEDTRGKSRSAALAWLRQAAAVPGLDAGDPLRAGALVRIASLEQDRGDAVAARTAYAQSGLSANQCALIDNPPKLVHAGGVFPDEARQWGFEGWTRTQFDVGADGKVLHERAIVSYPPFVFTRAGVKTIASSVYSKSYRPDGGLGCGASTQGVRFTMGS